MSTATASGVLDRVGKLVALTASSFEEEARTAALRACELIRRHGLRVVPPGQVADEPRAYRQPPPEEPRDWRWIRSKYPGRCADCGSRYFEGDRVSWLKGYGCRCADCERRTRGAA